MTKKGTSFGSITPKQISEGIVKKGGVNPNPPSTQRPPPPKAQNTNKK
jgi:hypothetical protein